ncbi:MAG: hypothetical protein HY869_21045 [Chloroflexi bacterium]|nr:hypothetical protein [Chloroflexota bacterium]
MKKLLPYLTGAIFGLFVLGVFVAVVSISFSGLGHIFPDSIFNQAIGLVLFDFAALTWFLVFVSGCKSTMQFVWSALGFVVGLLGVLGLAGMEVGISSGWLIAEEVTKPLSYVFIAVLLGHLTLIYLHHGSAPEISASISLGIEKAKIQAEGMRQAELQLQQSGAQMGSVIRGRLVGETLRELNLDPSTVIDANALPVEMPIAEEGGGLRWPWQNLRLPWQRAKAQASDPNDMTKAVPVDMKPRSFQAEAPAAVVCWQCKEKPSQEGSFYCGPECEKKAAMQSLKASQDWLAELDVKEEAEPLTAPFREG